jgi:hypothetical protein
MWSRTEVSASMFAWMSEMIAIRKRYLFGSAAGAGVSASSTSMIGIPSRTG